MSRPFSVKKHAKSPNIVFTHAYRLVSSTLHCFQMMDVNMSSAQSFFYEFVAIRGLQAGRPYYVAMCPLNVFPKIFDFKEADLSADYRAQRILEQRRVPEIANYIVENQDSYVFSSITASVNGDMKFEPATSTMTDIGRLKVDMTASFHINDGQHRRAAIEQALEQAPELSHETISVVLFPDQDLQRRQQLFADLNKHAVKPTTSLNVLYDHRDDMSALTRRLVKSLSIFKNLTELERNSISHTSRKLFTLSSIHQATAKLLGKSGRANVEESDFSKAHAFWQAVGTHMHDWEAVRRGRFNAGELRRDQIQTCGLVLQALAIMGQSLIESHPTDWQQRLAPLAEIDWSRQNAIWEGRALHAGVLRKSRTNVILTANLLKRFVGLPLTENEQLMETQHVVK